MSLIQFIDNLFGTQSTHHEKQLRHPFDDHFPMFPRMFFPSFDDSYGHDRAGRYRGGYSIENEMENMFNEADAMMGAMAGRFGMMDDLFYPGRGRGYRLTRWPDDSVDRDIDDLVRTNGLKPMTEGRMIPIEGGHGIINPMQEDGSWCDQSNGCYQAKMYSRSMTGDGRIQEVKKYKDSKGNVIEEKSRTVDGKTYSVIDKKRPDGEEEHSENFYNMDGGDIDDFEKRWNERRSILNGIAPGHDAKAIKNTSHVTYDDGLAAAGGHGTKNKGGKGLIGFLKEKLLLKKAN